jgi:hypothetical protein
LEVCGKGAAGRHVTSVPPTATLNRAWHSCHNAGVGIDGAGLVLGFLLCLLSELSDLLLLLLQRALHRTRTHAHTHIGHRRITLA